MDVETTDQRIVIRIRDRALFGPASAYLRESFRPVLIRVGRILRGVEGRILVAGHTDDLPIFTERYRSNWELSSSRAVSVVHELIDEAGIEPPVGSVGDSCNNALAETIIGLYETEIIRHRGPWPHLDAVEFATLEGVDWYNHRRPLGSNGDIPPELEAVYHQQTNESGMAA